MRFKVGDRVRIKSIDWYNENRDELGYIDCGKHLFYPLMSKYCGNIFTISDVYSDFYQMYENRLNWTDEMIEGLVEEECSQDFIEKYCKSCGTRCDRTKEYLNGCPYYNAYRCKTMEKETKPKDMGEVSDGYHTFNELYEYRMLYNAALFNEFAKQFGVKEEDVNAFLQKKADESKIKNHYNEIQSGLRSLVEKYKNKYIIINDNIIRITDIISEFGKFIVRGVGFNQFDTWTGLNTYVIDKYHYSLPLSTAEHDVEDVDIFLEDRILSKGAASLHVEEYLKTQKEHINNTFFNEEYTPDFSDW